MRYLSGERGAYRRRNGGGPGGGCARMPVGIYLGLHAVGIEIEIEIFYNITNKKDRILPSLKTVNRSQVLLKYY
jgi:hypothetical protein